MAQRWILRVACVEPVTLRDRSYLRERDSLAECQKEFTHLKEQWRGEKISVRAALAIGPRGEHISIHV